MPCPTCDSLAPMIEIHSPKMLRDLAASLAPYLRDGRLDQVGGDETIADIAEGKWGDVIKLTFCCTSCRSWFELAAETYHGSGGCWRRVHGTAVK